MPSLGQPGYRPVGALVAGLIGMVTPEGAVLMATGDARYCGKAARYLSSTG